MTDFNARPLGVLERIYRFVGGLPDNIRSVELGLPIQRVHDVSREVELGSGFDRAEGWYLLRQRIVHSGATTERVTLNLYDFISPFEPFRADQYTAWVMDVSFYHLLPGTISFISVALTLPDTYPGATAGPFAANPSNTRLIFFGNKTVQISNDAAVGDSIAVIPDNTNPQHILFPIHTTSGSILLFRETSTEAMEGYTTILLWVGALGVTPPGMQ